MWIIVLWWRCLYCTVHLFGSSGEFCPAQRAAFSDIKAWNILFKLHIIFLDLDFPLLESIQLTLTGTLLRPQGHCDSSTLGIIVLFKPLWPRFPPTISTFSSFRVHLRCHFSVCLVASILCLTYSRINRLHQLYIFRQVCLAFCLLTRQSAL